MRFSPRLENFRFTTGEYASFPGDTFGAFSLPGPCGQRLQVLASDGLDPDIQLQGWEHVSVSTKNRNPNWQEMCYVKNMFWAPEETVIQYHPPASQYVNCHPYTLHLWRPINYVLPLPPSILVGPKCR